MRSFLAFEIYTDIIHVVLICKYACTYDEKVDRFAELVCRPQFAVYVCYYNMAPLYI